MNFLEVALNEFLDFFRLGGLYGILMSGNYSSLRSIDGILAVLAPLAPVVFFGEMLFVLVLSKGKIKEYKVTLLIILTNRILSHLLGFSVIMFCYGAFSRFAIVHASMTWYWFIFCYLFYELGTFVYHYTAHNIRLLWCFHSIHHSPEDLNAVVTLRTFYLENLYTEFVRTTIMVLSGAPLMMYFLIMIIDSIWGAFVHVSEKVMKNGRLGILNKLVLTPSHHRVHHARNPLYLDTNYSSMLNIWDHIFRTYQEEDKQVPVEYGITREYDSNNFWDVYFGEIILLWKDVKSADGIITKLKYIFMPPGWNPVHPQDTAKYLRTEFIRQQKEDAAVANSLNK